MLIHSKDKNVTSFLLLSIDWDGDEDDPYEKPPTAAKGKGGGLGSESLTLKSISSKGRIVRSRWTSGGQQGRR